MRERPLFAGIELGGTKCVCLLASGPEEILAEERLATGDPAATLTALASVIAGWHSQHTLRAIGLASFGPLERDPASPRFGQLLDTPKPGWSGFDLIAPLQHIGLPIELDTDVNGAALAEGRWGAARGLSDYVYVTVGTGIGVGTIIGGRTIGRHAHSEAGHLRIARLRDDDWPGACLYHGDCVEGLACGPAIAARTGRAPESLSVDDPAWDAVAHALAALCHNLVLTVVPERILVGGGVALGQPQLLTRVRTALAASLGGYAGAAQLAVDQMDRFLTLAALGALAGPLGAVAVAMRRPGPAD